MPAWVGRGSSGASTRAGFRVKDRGATEELGCGLVSVGARSLDVKGAGVPLLVPVEKVPSVSLVRAGPIFGLTISCSPFRFMLSSESFEVAEYRSSDIGFGGYPYITSNSDMDVVSTICSSNSSTVAVSDNKIVDDPDGPRTRILMATGSRALRKEVGKVFRDSGN